jgi:hypothetical protein
MQRNACVMLVGPCGSMVPPILSQIRLRTHLLHPQVFCTVETFKGRVLVQLRQYYEVGGGGEAGAARGTSRQSATSNCNSIPLHPTDVDFMQPQVAQCPYAGDIGPPSCTTAAAAPSILPTIKQSRLRCVNQRLLQTSILQLAVCQPLAACSPVHSPVPCHPAAGPSLPGVVLPCAEGGGPSPRQARAGAVCC